MKKYWDFFIEKSLEKDKIIENDKFSYYTLAESLSSVS